MNQEAPDRALRPRWRWESHETPRVKNETSSPFPRVSCQTPGCQACTLPTPEKKRNLPSECLQTSQQHWWQVWNFEEKWYPTQISVQQPDSTPGWKQKKDILVTQGPTGTALGCTGGSEVPTQTREATRKEEGSVWERRFHPKETRRGVPGEKSQDGRWGAGLEGARPHGNQGSKREGNKQKHLEMTQFCSLCREVW